MAAPSEKTTPRGAWAASISAKDHQRWSRIPSASGWPAAPTGSPLAGSKTSTCTRKY
jgi:hypothetical protein